MTVHYTQGYAFFGENLAEMVTIRKLRPKAIAGLLCGPGGAQDDDENIFECQAREFKEETGIETTVDEWLYMGDIITFDGKSISIFCAFGNKFKDARTTTDETIYKDKVADLVRRDDLVREFSDLVAASLDPGYPKIRYHEFTTRYMMAG